MELSKKIALVLGATRGIGRATALALAEAGTTIIAPYYDWPNDCQEFQQELQAHKGDHLFVRTDLRDIEAVNNLAAHIDAAYGHLDILINNIERGGMPVVHGPYTPEQWKLEFDTTVQAKWWVYQAVKPLLEKTNEGAIINISSIAGQCGRSGPAGSLFNDGYAAANRAIASFTETWARECAPRIKVNELMLGLFESRHAEGTRGWSLLTESQRRQIKEHILLQRTGKIEEAVKTILFLLRDASYMTGATLRLDGGYLLAGESPMPVPPGVENLDIELD